MRVGFVTNLLWDRYGPLWVRLLGAVGAEVTYPEREAVREAWSDDRAARVPGVAARGAAAQALALSSCDRVLVPHLNPGYEGTRGSAQDPFVASFPDALAQAVAGLPPLLAVPAEKQGDALETVALETMVAVSQDAGSARRAWRRFRALAAPRQRAASLPAAPASAERTVGLVGQPWTLSDGVREVLCGAGEHVVSAHDLPPGALRAEGHRVDAAWAPTDAEAVGAARLFARRAGIDGVRLVVDRTASADVWLERRVRERVRKPLEVVALQDDPELLSAALPGEAPEGEDPAP